MHDRSSQSKPLFGNRSRPERGRSRCLAGGVWKPRTNPYSYQGDNKALSIILQAREETGLPIDAEVMDAEQLELALEAKVDALQVGTRNALNYSLLQIGKMSAETHSAVLLGGRHMASPDEFIAAAEYIVAEGNPDACLPSWDYASLGRLSQSPRRIDHSFAEESYLGPVVVDPSHSVGHSDYVLACSLAAIAYGADGLLYRIPRIPRGDRRRPQAGHCASKMGELIQACRSAFPHRYKAG